MFSKMGYSTLLMPYSNEAYEQEKLIGLCPRCLGQKETVYVNYFDIDDADEKGTLEKRTCVECKGTGISSKFKSTESTESVENLINYTKTLNSSD